MQFSVMRIQVLYVAYIRYTQVLHAMALQDQYIMVHHCCYHFLVLSLATGRVILHKGWTMDASFYGRPLSILVICQLPY